MIKVLKAGFYASIQDKGRVGFTSKGVPVSGALDSFSSDIANSILNNSLEDAVLEITFGAIELHFLCDTFISISGGDFSPMINEKSVKINSGIKVFKNDVLSFGKINFGVRCYLAVKGGFQTQKVLESRSSYKNITDNFKIYKNDILSIKRIKTDFETANTSIKSLKNHFETKPLECLKGPEFSLLSEYQKSKFFDTLFTISKNNNRMGYLLNERITNKLPSILTSAVLPGTVQLTPSGTIIILMRDCQVTGGYPRVLHLTDIAVNQLSQKTMGHNFRLILKNG